MLSSRLVRNAGPQVDPGVPHGMCTTERDKVNSDILEFIKG